MIKNLILFLNLLILLPNLILAQVQRNISFCGEPVPMDKEFIADKLMNVIKKQIPNVNLPDLRKRTQSYFPIVEKYLKQHGLPEDLKYLPIVESGFVSSALSGAGARGFWQIMPATALQYGMIISSENQARDDRDDIYKSSAVACKLLRDNYKYILNRYKIASWVLASAAYNFGVGNMSKAIEAQGTNYFLMKLNTETANYVYKIIAVKELFEYPELYMKNFGYNVFSSEKQKSPIKNISEDEDEVFKELSLNLTGEESQPKQSEPKFTFVMAHLKGDYKNFKDGGFITIQLDEPLITSSSYSRGGFTFKVQGWIIDDRVHMDLGYGHDVILCDLTQQKGLSLSELKNKNVNVLLKKVIEE